MSEAIQTEAGVVASLWRYPVKSMRGEELDRALVGERGLSGDRAYALVDGSDGKVATAKNPRKWPNLFAFRATLVQEEGGAADRHSLRIVMPDGQMVTGEQRDVDQILSKALNRSVTLTATEQGQPTLGRSSVSGAWTGKSEAYWPDIEGLPHREAVTDFDLPPGTFFDCATVHLLTTATLERLHNFCPEGRFEIPRFRPNIVVEAASDDGTFIENSWVGRSVEIGSEVRLTITGPCGRCVMTTLPQGDLPEDRGILRTIVRQNRGRIGVYGAVLRGGTIRRGDRVRVA